jgi:hypothetical protein
MTSAQLPLGTSLSSDRLSIVRRLGWGGMGIVYEAFDAQRRERVALKTIARPDAAGVYQLKNEFRALSDVVHPNLVRLYELFAERDAWFFTMELVQGKRFDEWVRPRGVLDPARLRAALPQLLRAVLAIHAAGKIHRDLKPSNVLVTRSGRLAVLDFGLSGAPEVGAVGQTVPDTSVVGTPEYMSPEQALGNPATAASDVYAIGVMLFEALTGRLPFEGPVHALLAQKLLNPVPASRLSLAPEDLRALCLDLLAQDPAGRPTAAQLHARLGGGRHELRSLAPRLSGPRPRPRRPLAGAQAELRSLHAAYEAARDGSRPVVVMVSGMDGLEGVAVDAFLARRRAEGHAVVLSGRCHARESVPFKGLDALMDDLSRHLRKQDPLHLAGLIPRDVSALRRLFPVLGRIEAIAQAPERPVKDTLDLERRAFLALGELLGRIRDRQPLVLALGELQWSDAASTALLHRLLQQQDAPRLLLVASHPSETGASRVLAPLYRTLESDRRIDLRRIRISAPQP